MLYSTSTLSTIVAKVFADHCYTLCSLLNPSNTKFRISWTNEYLTNHMHYSMSLLTTTLKANIYYGRYDFYNKMHSCDWDVYFQGKPSGLVMTNLRPSLLMVWPVLASRITSVGIPVTSYLSPSFSYTATRKIWHLLSPPSERSEWRNCFRSMCVCVCVRSAMRTDQSDQFKAVKATDFKFNTHLPRDGPDMTP